MKRTSIRSRLVTRLTLVLVAVAVMTNAALYIYLRGEIVEQYDAALQTQARAIVAVWQAVGESDHAGAVIRRAFPNSRFGHTSGDYVRVMRGDRSTVFQVPPAASGEVGRGPTRRSGRDWMIYDLTLPNGQAGRAIEIGIGPSPAFSIVFAESRREMDGTLTNFGIWLFAIGGGLSLVAIGLVLTIARRELLPLADFSEAVGRLDADSLSYRFPTAGLADELVPVSARLNDLLRRLDDAFGRERRFTGNVAHELRTPLAELRSMVEVAMKWPPEPDGLRRHHEQVLEVVQRMSTLTQALLTLVRSEGMRLATTPSAVDLTTLLKSAALPHERSAAERGVGIDFILPESLKVLADPAVLSSLFDNLFSNAALYAMPGSRITCDAHADGDGRTAVVTMINAVTDLTVDDVSRLDEPFWRKDPARSAGEHAGLGLTLVRSYAAASRTAVRFRLDSSRRLTAELTLPLLSVGIE